MTCFTPLITIRISPAVNETAGHHHSRHDLRAAARILLGAGPPHPPKANQHRPGRRHHYYFEYDPEGFAHFFDVDPKKVSVIYHGIDLDAPLLTEPVADLPEQYVLFVGDRSGYKNFYLFLNAIRPLLLDMPDLSVVLAGGGPMHVADREFIQRLGLANRIRHINATDGELTYLYQNAQLFVYPSLYEGFGLPILEAFKAQCPMLLSDTECFREVADDAAVYFKSTDLNDLTSKLSSTLADSALRAKLVERGNERLKQFPLQRSIDQTLDVYHTLA